MLSDWHSCGAEITFIDADDTAAVAAAAADDDDVMWLCWQATDSTDRVTKLMKFYGTEYNYDTLQQSNEKLEESAAGVSWHSFL